MKFKIKTLLLPLALIVLFTRCEKEADYLIFPDDAFLTALISLGVDTNGDGNICTPEAEAIDTLDIHGRLIKSLEGIGAFVNLVYLECSNNELIHLDLSKNTKLEELICESNQISSLDISNCTHLVRFLCTDNLLTHLDISKNQALELLACEFNQISSLDISNNTLLTGLICSLNQLTGLDVSNNPGLLQLRCSHNLIAELDISTNMMLEYISFSGNQLTSLDLSKNTALNWIVLEDMPSLNEVCVWTTPFPPDGVWIVQVNSPNINFTTECS